jgi:acetate kinase
MILSLNSGSSSIKFALYKGENLSEKIFSGQLERIGKLDSSFSFKKGNEVRYTLSVKSPDYQCATIFLLDYLKKQVDCAGISAIGHRVVHGMRYTQPELITAQLPGDLKDMMAYDQDHLPDELKIIEAFQKHYPGIPQFACFDTSFHRDMPAVAKLLPIPLRFQKKGVHRYGFHRLSCAFLIQKLTNIAGKKAASGRIILCHLGTGASVNAVHHGKSIDTTRGNSIFYSRMYTQYLK